MTPPNIDVAIMSQDIPVELIDAGRYRIRMHTPGGSNVDRLAESIRQVGLLEAIGVLRDGFRYHLLYGERRLAAIKSLNLAHVHAKIFTKVDDAVVIALTENIQREQLNPLEEARTYQRLLDNGITQGHLGKIIGKTQSYISHKLRLQKLPHSCAVLVSPLGWYTEAHLRQLLRLEKIVKDAGRSDPPDRLDSIYNAMFEATRAAIAEGRPNNGVINMTTYYQDKIAWHNTKVTVLELKLRIDWQAAYWRNPDRYEDFDDFVIQRKFAVV